MIQVYHVKRADRWRFRMLDDAGETIYTSNGSYVDADEAKRVASAFNRSCYRGEHKVRVIR